jgi:hypothetical protein
MQMFRPCSHKEGGRSGGGQEDWVSAFLTSTPGPQISIAIAAQSASEGRCSSFTALTLVCPLPNMAGILKQVCSKGLVMKTKQNKITTVDSRE